MKHSINMYVVQGTKFKISRGNWVFISWFKHKFTFELLERQKDRERKHTQMYIQLRHKCALWRHSFASFFFINFNLKKRASIVHVIKSVLNLAELNNRLGAKISLKKIYYKLENGARKEEKQECERGVKGIHQRLSHTKSYKSRIFFSARVCGHLCDWVESSGWKKNLKE